MIYRYRIYEGVEQKYRIVTEHYKNAMRSLLEGFPTKLVQVLENAEIHNELTDFEKQEVYLKITTDIDESAVSQSVQQMLDLSGLRGTRLN